MPIKITMPALSPTMTEGTLASWLKSEGDAVESGDVIAEIETDKATMEVEAVDDGVIGKIIIEAGTEGVAVNSTIAVLLEDGEDKSALDGFDTSGGAPKAVVAAAAQDVSGATEVITPTPAAPKSAPAANTGSRVFASPLARRMAEQKGIDIASVSGSGPRGRIVKADIEGFKAGAASSNAPAQDANMLANAYGMEYTEIPNNNIKKITAKRLLESKNTVPHFYLTIDCQLDNLLAARKEINEKANGEYKLSVNDFIIKANAMALKAYPAANVSWTDAAVLQYKHADISVAVATPNGLITPIIKRAEEKGLREISDEMKMLAGKAREGKLKPEEFQGGTFSI